MQVFLISVSGRCCSCCQWYKTKVTLLTSHLSGFIAENRREKFGLVSCSTIENSKNKCFSSRRYEESWLSTILWEASADPCVVSNRRFFWLHSACLLVVAKGAKPKQKWGQAQQQHAGTLEVMKGSSGVCTVSRCAVKDRKAGVLPTFACVCVYVSVCAPLVSCWASGAAWEFCRRKTVFPMHLPETFALPCQATLGLPGCHLRGLLA